MTQGSQVDAFLMKVERTPAPTGLGARGRLFFALDATASRESTWDSASQLQAEMFQEAASLGGLELQLVHYRGFGEFETGPWVTDSGAVLSAMAEVRCAPGKTQIEKVLRHAARQARATPKRLGGQALVFVGDAFEEDIDRAVLAAGALALSGVPAFMLQEGDNAPAARAFKEIAKLTGGAHLPFTQGSVHQLRELLRAVAAYAAGGKKALLRTSVGRSLIARMNGPPKS